MPKRDDIHCVLIIGSGPIVIGQACEFDYSGTQACKALREEGIRVVLLNSNPATIMTDPEMADRTYIEPITPETVEAILSAERAAGQPIDAILPTLGGQTGLNCAVEADERGYLARHGVRLIGASREAIHRAEDRTAFKQAMEEIGVDVPHSAIAHSLPEALEALERVGLPCVIRPAYTLGGSGGGIAWTLEQFREQVSTGLEQSRVHQVLIEECLLRWKEYELEVMRDCRDNVVIICSIENVDPMGVHTGDSITVAPAMTLTDREYQRMRDAAIAIIRKIGVDTGGANIQFAVHPETGRMVAIEMNPRVSRSSALASKATGYPIARIAAKLAIGYTLDELPNDITRRTSACFEPTIDYVVVKMPRWAFEKFPEADETLGTQMKSVGEAMAIGRTFPEALQKAIRSMEIKRWGMGLDGHDAWWRLVGQPARASALVPAGGGGGEPAPLPVPAAEVAAPGRRDSETPPDWREDRAGEWPIPYAVIHDKLARPCQGRPYYIRYALRMGWTVEQIARLTGIDPWFIAQIERLVRFEERLVACRALEDLDADLLAEAKRLGYSDVQLATAVGATPRAVRDYRQRLGVEPVYRLVDTCAAEFEAFTPYYYSTYERAGMQVGLSGSRRRATALRDDEFPRSEREKVVIVGGGPNRIGQGIEFDYCCVHAVFEARAMGFETVMINSNPETVSTDYDTSDLLFFEPLTHEDVLNVCERLARGGGGLRGVVVQFGGQTPLNLARGLEQAGVPILGTSPQSIREAEDRDSFQQIVRDLGLRQPRNGVAHTRAEAAALAERIGYPVLVRPSWVLGGRAMEICNHRGDLERFLDEAFAAAGERDDPTEPASPVLIDEFLLDATEVDVDAVADFLRQDGGDDDDDPEARCVVCGVMEHIEEAGVHSGDSACATPPYSLGPDIVDELERQTKLLARRLRVCGLMNVQFAVRNREVYVLEVNPRASRTVPFISKATGIPWARVATRVMLGEPLPEALKRFEDDIRRRRDHVAVKVSVFPFHKFRGVDVVLGPEMRSTGEAMGIGESFAQAYAKGCAGANLRLPTEGTVFISVNDTDKPHIVPIARDLAEMGFHLVATAGTHLVLEASGVPARRLPKIAENRHPNILDMIEAGTVQMLINTPSAQGRDTDEGRIRAAAARHQIALITKLSAARAAVKAIRELRRGSMPVRALQDVYAGAARDG